jgi:hypothetical protein
VFSKLYLVFFLSFSANLLCFLTYAVSLLFCLVFFFFSKVTSVGINTEWGLLMASISEDNGEETPLQV